jgi:hypothetical protein
MEVFREILENVHGLIENGNGATESDLRGLWNDLSNAISDHEKKSERVGLNFWTCKRCGCITIIPGIVCINKYTAGGGNLCGGSFRKSTDEELTNNPNWENK